MTTHHLDRLIGIFLCVMCLLCVFLWIPADSKTGLVETVRRRLIIGDALAPTLASLLGLVCAVVLIIKPAPQPGMRRNALISVSVYIACFQWRFMSCAISALPDRQPAFPEPCFLIALAVADNISGKLYQLCCCRRDHDFQPVCLY